MPSSIISPFPVFNDLDGSPLENGYIFIGQSNLNPETAPVNVFWDAALTIPAAQPIRTIGGFPSRNGSPGNVYINADTYSITVRNSRRVFVYSVASAQSPMLVGNTIPGDDVSFIQADIGAVTRTMQDKVREIISVKDLGAVGDGVTDDTQAFVDAINSNTKIVLIPQGVYYVPDPEFVYSVTSTPTLWLSAGGKYTTVPGGSGTNFSGIFFGAIMPRDFGPIAIANITIPNTIGENAGLKVITGQFPTETPALDDRVAGTFIVDNLSKTIAGGGIWGLDVVALQGATNPDGTPATDSMTRAMEIEVNKVVGGPNPDPWSGNAPFRSNGIECTAATGVHQPTAAMMTYASDSTGAIWWQIGIALSRITKWGVLFKKNPATTFPGGLPIIDTGKAFGGGITVGASIRDESDSTSVISVAGQHVNIIDLSPATSVGTFVRGVTNGPSNIGFSNFVDYDNTILIDSGSTAAQNSQIIFNDRGSAKWTIGKLPDGRFHFFNNDQSITPLVINPYEKSIALSSGAKIFSEAGSPEGVVSAPIGSLYTNISGGVSTTLYVKTSGTGNTGWTAK